LYESFRKFAGQPFFAKIGFPAPLPKIFLDAGFVELRSLQNRLSRVIVFIHRCQGILGNDWLKESGAFGLSVTKATLVTIKI